MRRGPQRLRQRNRGGYVCNGSEAVATVLGGKRTLDPPVLPKLIGPQPTCGGGRELQDCPHVAAALDFSNCVKGKKRAENDLKLRSHISYAMLPCLSRGVPNVSFGRKAAAVAAREIPIKLRE